MDRRARINLIGVAVLTAVLLAAAATQLLADAVLDRTYPLFAELPVAGGLQTDKEVTYNGQSVGLVRDVTLTADGVRVEMAIQDTFRIPRDLDVVVLRRSAVGEQALELQPRSRVTSSTAFHDEGDTIDPGEVTLPPEVQELFQTADDVFGSLDPETTGRAVGALADVVRGRRDDIRRIIVDSGDFSQAIGDNGEDYDRLMRESRVVNGELAEHRDDLAGLFTDIADATTVLTEMRASFEGLLVEGPPALAQTGDLIERSQANLSCSIDYLGNLAAMTNEPRNLENASEALRTNRYFFEGFDAFTALDPYGHAWQRVLFLPPQEPPADSFLPEKRPFRDVLPGGACNSPFGPGAPAATQASYTGPRVPEVRVIPPADPRAQGVARPVGSTTPSTPTSTQLAGTGAGAGAVGGGSGGSTGGPTGAGPTGAGPTAAVGSRGLPLAQTGLAVTAALLAVGLLGGGAAALRRFRPGGGGATPGEGEEGDGGEAD